MTQSLPAWWPIPIGRIVQFLFTAAGESAVYALALALNNGADSMSRILLFPSLWERHSEVPGNKLWTIYEVFLWHAGPGSSPVVKTVVCLCACIWP